MAICHHVVLVANYILTFLKPFCKVMFSICQQKQGVSNMTAGMFLLRFPFKMQMEIIVGFVECRLDLSILAKRKGKYNKYSHLRRSLFRV